MIIKEVVITPSVISYYVRYNNLDKTDKLVQYVNTSLRCLRRIDIDKTIYQVVSTTIVRIIHEWIKPLSMF